MKYYLVQVIISLSTTTTQSLSSSLGKIRSGGAVKRAVMTNINIIKDALTMEMSDNDATHYSDLLAKEMVQATTMHRYIRINEIKLSIPLGTLILLLILIIVVLIIIIIQD